MESIFFHILKGKQMLPLAGNWIVMLKKTCTARMQIANEMSVYAKGHVDKAGTLSTRPFFHRTIEKSGMS